MILGCRAHTRRVGLGFGAKRRSTGIVALEEDVAVFGVLGTVVSVVPRNDESAVRRCGNYRRLLCTLGGGVDDELAPDSAAIGGIHLRHDGFARAILTCTGRPGHHETAGAQANDVRLVLLTGRHSIDQEFGPYRIVVGIVTLTIDTVAIAVGIALVGPYHHIATIAQMCDRRFRLPAARRGVDDPLQTDWRDTVGFGRHVDLHCARIGCTSVAVGNANGDGAAGRRVGDAVGVSQVLDDPLDRLHGGVGVELHRKLGTVLTVADDGADYRAFEAHAVAGNPHLVGAATLVAHTKLVLRIDAHAAKLIEGTVVGDVVHLQQAAIKVCRIAVEQADARVDELRCGVDGVLGKGDAACHVHKFGVGTVGEIAGLAKQLLINVIRVRVVTVVTPGCHEAAVGEPEHHRGIHVGVGIQRVGAQHLINPFTIAIELLHIGTIAVTPDNGEAAVGERSRRRLVLGAGRIRIHPELGAVQAAVRVVTLSKDTGRAGTVLSVGRPGNHETTICQHRHVGLVLVAVGIGIDLELTAEPAAV